MASSPDAVVAGVTTGAGASLIAVLSDIDLLFGAHPMLGFGVMGILGGFSGWCLMIETGRLDERSLRQFWCILGRRMALGLALSIGVGVAWSAYGAANKGLWMLGAGIVSAAPVEMMRAGKRKFLRNVR